jgi:hypothetical protein
MLYGVRNFKTESKKLFKMGSSMFKTERQRLHWS